MTPFTPLISNLKMNKNNIIGFLLIAVVLIGFSWYNQPSAEEQRAAFVQDSIAKAKHAEMERPARLPLLSARLMPKQRLRLTQPPSSIRHSKARLRRLY